MAIHRTIWLIVTRARARLRGHLTRGRTERGQGVSDSSAMAQLASWSDAQLYSVWCATGTELLRALHAEHTATAAEARKHLLAEIERRHPTETAAWLKSDAILSGEPPRFLKPRA